MDSSDHQGRKANRLAREKSPYLQQHAYNPVDWYPWGEEAFEKAQREDKPIFLSIGYSTCHWCHVMERESFESEVVAHFLNDHFVSIKVDREERPDIDAIYMAAVQAISGSGGWPMTVFLSPDLKPFFGGTYFPPQPAYGRPSFLQLLNRIQELWIKERGSLTQSSETLMTAIKGDSEQNLQVAERGTLIHGAYYYFERAFDEEFGGFGNAPKFPRPVQLDFLFNYTYTYHVTHAQEMALTTLKHIAWGGIHDHLAGGFHRYSVDREWRVSHFEKMLYDQAQLLHSFLDAYQLTKDILYSDAANGIVHYVLTEMKDKQGAFYSAEDADSEGEEGTFYVWTTNDLHKLLSDEEYKVIAEHFNITESGNFEHGKNVLHSSGDIDTTAKKLGFSHHVVSTTLESAKQKLLDARSKRVRPHLDDKILVSWNGLMLGAIARAGDVLNKPEYISSAIRAGQFLWDNLYSEGILYHRWRDGEARFPGYLETYAFLIKGFLELYEATFDCVWLERAVELQQLQDKLLWDEREGAYFTSEDRKDVIIRTKSEYDGAEPSGNSIAAINLIKLYHLTEVKEYLNKANQTIEFFLPKIAKYPYAMPELMVALMRIEAPGPEIVLDVKEKRALQEFKQAILSTYLPDATITSLDAAWPNTFAQSLVNTHAGNNAYVCHNFMCNLPATSPEELKNQLVARYLA